MDRSAFSTTVKDGGAFTTRTYPEQVNFEDEGGDWKAIDRSLEREPDGTYRPVAVDGDAVIPSTLTRPVVLEHDGRSVSFRLLGADAGADRDVTGTKASFEDALFGVDVSYKVRPTGLKELITLSGRASQRSFTYEVRSNTDLAAKIDGGDLVFSDSSTEERFRVAAPLAWDNAEPAQTANALTLSVIKTGDRSWRLTMRADDKWLDDPARVYPVTLDPDYYWIDGKLRFHGANQDCALAGGNQQTLKQCAYQNLQIGYGNSRPYKSVMKFDIAAAIPAYATPTAARFLAWQFPSTQKFDVASRLRTVTSEWDNNATWNNRKDGTPWTTAGGDVSTDPALTGDPITVGPSGYWSYWPAPLAAINGWIKKTLPNYGFQVSTDLTTPTVKSAYEFTSTDGNQANWPALEVTWVPDTIAPTGVVPNEGLGTADQDFLNGNQTITINASAQDEASGVAKLELLRDGSNVAATAAIPCPGTLCPLSAAAPLNLTTTALSEGKHTLALRATDGAGNVTTTSAWSVYVDRTAPPVAGTANVAYFDASLREATIGWAEVADPALADGSPGSGAADVAVRYRINGGAFSAWTTNEADFGLDLEGVDAGATVTLEVRSSDRAGNSSAITPQSLVISEPTFDNPNARIPQAICDITSDVSQANLVRGSRTFADAGYSALGNGECRGTVWQFKRVSFTMCVQYKNRFGGWTDNTFRTNKACGSRRITIDGDLYNGFTTDFTHVQLCYPGSRDIRVRTRIGIRFVSDGRLRVIRNPGSTSVRQAVQCNNQNAWRYLARASSDPGATLGDALRYGSPAQYPPNSSIRTRSQGFDAHHIVPATHTTTEASVLQALAYSCEIIEPNGARNGIWLRGGDLTGPNDPRSTGGVDDAWRSLDDEAKARAYHPTLHKATYFDNVAYALSPAISGNYDCDSQAVASRLNGIKNALRTNEFPYDRQADFNPIGDD